MSIKRQLLVIDIVNIIMRFIPTYLFIAILIYHFDHKSPLHTLILFPAPVISYLIRKHTHYIWSFLVFHSVILAIYLITVTNIYLMTATGIYVITLAAVAYYRKNRGNELENTSSLLLVLIVLLYLFSYFVDMSNLNQLCFILSLVYVLLYVINRYLLNLVRFVYNHEGMTNVPFQQIRNSNHVMVIFLSCLFLIVMCIFSYIPLGRLFSYLGNQFIRGLRYLFSLIRFEEPEDIPEPEEAPIIFEDYPITEPSRLMEIILDILQWVAIILVIVLLIAFILHTLYQIYRYFYLKSEDVIKDKIEFLSPFIQKERVQGEHKRILRNLFGRSNNAQIRKSFTQAVTAQLSPDTKLDKSLTPSQLSNYIFNTPSLASAPLPEERSHDQQESLISEWPDDTKGMQEKQKVITKYYEKARYSNEECSKEEVRLLKRLLKNK